LPEKQAYIFLKTCLRYYHSGATDKKILLDELAYVRNQIPNWTFPLVLDEKPPQMTPELIGKAVGVLYRDYGARLFFVVSFTNESGTPTILFEGTDKDKIFLAYPNVFTYYLNSTILRPTGKPLTNETIMKIFAGLEGLTNISMPSTNGTGTLSYKEFNELFTGFSFQTFLATVIEGNKELEEFLNLPNVQISFPYETILLINEMAKLSPDYADAFVQVINILLYGRLSAELPSPLDTSSCISYLSGIHYAAARFLVDDFFDGSVKHREKHQVVLREMTGGISKSLR
jgi:hypothetical protein